MVSEVTDVILYIRCFKTKLIWCFLLDFKAKTDEFIRFKFKKQAEQRINNSGRKTKR